jgi:chromatin segregation and condensation protein Rec8/ScpA/Scc1 (kleisin family)
MDSGNSEDPKHVGLELHSSVPLMKLRLNFIATLRLIIEQLVYLVHAVSTGEILCQLNVSSQEAELNNP